MEAQTLDLLFGNYVKMVAHVTVTEGGRASLAGSTICTTGVTNGCEVLIVAHIGVTRACIPDSWSCPRKDPFG